MSIQDAELAELTGRNVLLSALDGRGRDRLAPSMELLDYDLRDEIYDRGQAIEQVLFPLQGVFSMVSEMDDGREVEIATVGYEGMLGLPVFLQAARTSSHRVFCQVPGRALTMGAGPFLGAVGDLPDLARTLNRYTLALLGQIAQASACNRLHDMVQRAARWLLLSHDRVRVDEFQLTQQFLAQMLGVPRGRVNGAAQALQEAGAIRYARGVVTVTDRAALEGQSCECYRIIRDEHERLLGAV